jgi:hypothetical protein
MVEAKITRRGGAGFCGPGAAALPFCLQVRHSPRVYPIAAPTIRPNPKPTRTENPTPNMSCVPFLLASPEQYPPETDNPRSLSHVSWHRYSGIRFPDSARSSWTKSIHKVLLLRYTQKSNCYSITTLTYT